MTESEYRRFARAAIGAAELHSVHQARRLPDPFDRQVALDLIEQRKGFAALRGGRRARRIRARRRRTLRILRAGG